MIAVFGSVNVDLIFALQAFPQPGQTLLSDGMSMEPGGKGANQACAAARDGAHVAMAGAVGDDPLAEAALDLLKAAGADISAVATVPGPTGCAAICTDRQGRNQIVVASGANMAARWAGLEPLLGPDTIVVTQMETGRDETEQLIRRAHAAGSRIIHNLAPAGMLAPDVLRMMHLLVVNEDEADWLARALTLPGADAPALHAALGAGVVRTLGGAGVEWATTAGAGQCPASAVSVVDTTAAGDCFVGVLAAALDRGDALPAAIGRANVAAGLSCTRHGSQRSLPSQAETDAALSAR